MGFADTVRSDSWIIYLFRDAFSATQTRYAVSDERVISE
jgi:hypothetical protein